MTGLCDVVYVINLDKSTNRWEFMNKQLSQTGVAYERFSAIYGYDALITNLHTNETFYGRDLKSNKNININKGIKHEIKCLPDNIQPVNFNYTSSGSGISTAGEIGLWCSHVKIWHDMLRFNYSSVLILEDDIRILDIKNFKNQLENFTLNLPESFDIGYIALTKYLPNTLLKPVDLLNNDYVKAFDSNFEARGTWGMVYSKKAAEILLSYETYISAIDGFLWNININEDYQSPFLPRLTQGLLEIYESSVQMVGLSDLPSDITEMGRSYYEHK